MSYQKRVIEKEVAVCCLNHAEAVALTNNAQESLTSSAMIALAQTNLEAFRNLPGQARVALGGLRNAQPQWTL